MNKKDFAVVAVALCLIATLSMGMPSAWIVSGATAPPFDLLAAVKDIQTKVNSISTDTGGIISQLSTLQGTLTDLEQKLWSGVDSVKNKLTTVGWSVDSIVETLTPGGAFYNYVNGWFWNFDHKLDSIQQQANSGPKVVFTAYGHVETVDNVEKILLRIRTNATCQIAITLNANFGADKDDYVSVFQDVWHTLYQWQWMLPVVHVQGTWPGFTNEVHSVTYASNSTQIQFKCEDSSAAIAFQLIAMGPPNTVVTQFYTDYPLNVTATY